MLRSALVIVAHPDDETMLMGGVLALLASQGVELHIACATRGEGGELGEPPAATRATLGSTREQELRCAAKQLGAKHVTLLGYIDPLIGPEDELFAFSADFGAFVDQIMALARSAEAQLILTHGSDGEYGHPAHALCHLAALQAAQRLDLLLYSAAAHVPTIEDRLWNTSDPAHIVLDIRPWLDIKEAAALCHASQHALFKRRRQLKTVRGALRAVEAFHRHHPPPVDEHPNDHFAQLLRAAGGGSP
ncbi:MAG: PIG-L family deacetylase [Chloroflexi bacterium]|nr:PIG-L family deacetylase [Chloroflexota bacterium]